MCNKGCVEVAKIVSEYEDIEEAEENASSELQKYECYNKICEGDYGHITYALLAYCISNGHLDCIKKIRENEDYFFAYHADSADVAIENNNIEMLKYIVEELGDVTISTAHMNNECKKYIDSLLMKYGMEVTKNRNGKCIGYNIKHCNKVCISNKVMNALSLE